MRIFSSMNTSASGLTAERLRLDIISSNLANANSTRTETGGPYRRKLPVFSESLQAMGVPAGVRVTAITEDASPFKRVHDPGHPDADKDGYVMLPNVDVINEMVDMITATRAYEANATVISSAKAMAGKALEIGRS